jgi:predicted O-methyltransferase YrrM
VNDIDLCTEILKPGGLMVMDDAASLLNLGPNHKGFPGHADVGFAIRDHIDTKDIYKHLFACGHNRVWIKNK